MSSEGRASSRRGSTEAPITKSDVGYQPHLFDLIYGYANIDNNTLNVSIPSIYLQPTAVDSAKILGHGASFTASVQPLPPGPQTVQYTVAMGELTAISVRPAPPRPRFVVYKTARIAFDAAGDPLPSYKLALSSVLTELHALLYPPLWNHPNIIACLGMAWGTNEFDSSHRLPVIVMEYAEHGTLADVLAKGPASLDVAQTFCFDVASGLQAIHAAGMVHGDIKAENVLICQGQHRQIAKLGDFGYSIVKEVEREKVMIGGTRPWKAPETANPIALEDLPFTDTFSLGLLIWSVSIMGASPFDLLLDNPSEQAIENLKKSDLLVSARTAEWVPQFILRVAQKAASATHNLASPSAAASQAVDKGPLTLAEVFLPMSETLRNLPPAVMDRLLQDALTKYIDQHKLYSKLDRIVALSLGLQPSSRNLSAITDILRPGVVPAEMHVTRSVNSSGYRTIRHTGVPDSIPHVIPAPSSGQVETDVNSSSDAVRTAEQANGVHEPAIEALSLQDQQINAQSSPTVSTSPPRGSWQKRGYKHSRFSWQAMRDQPPGVQKFTFEALNHMSDIPSRFLLAAALINGYGCQPDERRATTLLRECAEVGHEPSRAYLYRLHKACDTEDMPEYDTAKFLGLMARRGSIAALQDLADSGNVQEHIAVRWFLTYRGAGVGAPWFADWNMLNGITIDEWLDHDFLVTAAKTVGNINDYRINQRGDTLLHLTACLAEHKSRRFLVQDLGADVNSRNHAGDTPLISICRAGIAPSAIVFLQTLKADASLSSHNGETALHWLISFGDEVIAPLTADLLARGAQINATTTSHISHGLFEGTVDIDFFRAGTPLLWAVHLNRPTIVRVLLSHGADPEFRYPHNPNPLEWAAHFHRAECLSLLISHLQKCPPGEPTRPTVVVNMTGILHQVLASADKFSMILRNGGSRWLSDLRSTLDVLREKFPNATPDKLFGSPGNTPLYFAVEGGRDAAAEYMLEHDWPFPSREALLTSCGPGRRNPVLEAVRLGRLELVRKLTATEDGREAVRAKGRNPFSSSADDGRGGEEDLSWTALHILADEGQPADPDLLEFLVHDLGLDVHAPAGTGGETALSCALRANAFPLCEVLLALRANPGAKSTRAGLRAVEHPTTILGHVIVGNARVGVGERLGWLLRQEGVGFEVEGERRLSALHRGAMGCEGVRDAIGGKMVRREDYDWEANRAIMRQLVGRFRGKEELEGRCGIEGRTALHLAVACGNAGAVEVLVEAGADRGAEDEGGLTPVDLLAWLRLEEPADPVWKIIASCLGVLDGEGGV